MDFLKLFRPETLEIKEGKARAETPALLSKQLENRNCGKQVKLKLNCVLRRVEAF